MSPLIHMAECHILHVMATAPDAWFTRSAIERVTQGQTRPHLGRLARMRLVERDGDLSAIDPIYRITQQGIALVTRNQTREAA
jgi:hypothetical protein